MIGIRTGMGIGIGRQGSLLKPFPDILKNGNYVEYFDFTDPSTITKDANNLTSKIVGKLGSGIDLIQNTTANKPTHGADGLTFTTDDFIASVNFTYNQPETIYLVVRQNSWGHLRTIMDGVTYGSGLIHQVNGYTSDPPPTLGVYAGKYGLYTKQITIGRWVIVKVTFNGTSSKFRVNTLPELTIDAGGTNMGGIRFGKSANTSGYANFSLKAAIIGKTSDAYSAEMSILKFLKSKHKVSASICMIGDSTVSELTTPAHAWNIDKFMIANFVAVNLAYAGSTIEQQQNSFIATPAVEYDAVIIMIGLNDTYSSIPDTITKYQNLINTVRGVVGSLKKIIISTMIPNNRVAYVSYAALNEAILGNGATPIIGVDARINMQDTVLNAGNGTLSSIYDLGDGTHENDAGRQIIANLFDAKLLELGVVVPY